MRPTPPRDPLSAQPRSCSSASLAAACSEVSGVRDSTTDAVTPQAEAIDGLFWFSVILGTVVWLIVLGLLAVPIVRSWRRRKHGDHEVAPTERGPIRSRRARRPRSTARSRSPTPTTSSKPRPTTGYAPA